MMKPTLNIFIACFAMLLLTTNISAQHNTKIPKWLPENGNWMAETNKHQPMHTVVYFYTNNGEVIYKKTFDGVRLNLESKKVKMRLKKMLDEALVAWEKGETQNLSTDGLATKAQRQ